MKQVVEDNGGVYSGELTKDVCTHLIVASTTSTYVRMFSNPIEPHSVGKYLSKVVVY